MSAGHVGRRHGRQKSLIPPVYPGKVTLIGSRWPRSQWQRRPRRSLPGEVVGKSIRFPDGQSRAGDDYEGDPRRRAMPREEIFWAPGQGAAASSWPSAISARQHGGRQTIGAGDRGDRRQPPDRRRRAVRPVQGGRDGG